MRIRKTTTIKEGEVLYCKKDFINANADVYLGEYIKVIEWFGEKSTWYWVLKANGEKLLCNENIIDNYFSRKIGRAKRIIVDYENR